MKKNRVISIVGDRLFIKKSQSIDIWQRIRYISDVEIDTMNIKNWEKKKLKNESGLYFY